MDTLTISGVDIQIGERDISRSQTTGENASADLRYSVLGTDNDTIVKTALLQYSPETYDGLHRQTISLDPEEGGTAWSATVRYGRKRLSQTENTLQTFRFETSMETVHLTQALSNTPAEKSFAKTGETAPLSNGIIGWDGKNVNGCEIMVGAFHFSVLRRFSDTEMDAAYLQALSRKAPMYNNDPFWIWDTGEVLFLGASGGRTGDTTIQISGDTEEQLSGYGGITGVTCDNSDNGRLYISIEAIPLLANVRIECFKDEACIQKVAEVASGVIGQSNTLTAVNDSGIGGTITIEQYVTDTDAIVVTFPFPWELTLQFAVSTNRENLTVGEITGINKAGWEYLDIRRILKDVDAGGVTVKMPRAKYAYAHKTYLGTDFSSLKAGESPISE